MKTRGGKERKKRATRVVVKSPMVALKNNAKLKKMFRCQAEITRHVTPAGLAILIYIRGGYIHPAASMAMYSTQSAQDTLPPDSTPALWFLTRRSAAWQHHESCPYRVRGNETPSLWTALCLWLSRRKGHLSVWFEEHMHGLMFNSSE